MKKKANALLINYSGYPYSPCNLVPDNGLANLAGSLLEEGHNVKILDFSTTDSIKFLFPAQYNDRIKSITREIMASNAKGQIDKIRIADLKELDQLVLAHEKNVVNNFGKMILSEANSFEADFVGFKLWTGAGFEGSLLMAKLLKKEAPHLKIYGGGPHIDWFKSYLLDSLRVRGEKVFDAFCYGEGEEVAPLLAQHALGNRSLSDIPNLIYMSNGKNEMTPPKLITNLDSLPLPAYSPEIYPAMAGDTQKIKLVLIDESRGCVNKCNFCIHPQKSGNKWRLRSAKNLVSLIDHISKEVDTKIFRFAGSNPPPTLKKEIAKELIASGADIKYTAFGHARGFADEDFDLLKESGMYSIFVGIESLSQHILDKSINKRVSVQNIESFVNRAHDAGVNVVGSFIVPLPFDSSQTIAESYEHAQKLPLTSACVSPLGVVPESNYGRNSEYFGITIADELSYIRSLMDFRIKLFFPPSVNEDLPVKINGFSFKECSDMASKFASNLEGKGILTQVPDEMLLVSYYSTIANHSLFRDKTREYLSNGMYNEMKEVVNGINMGVRK